MDNSGYPFYEVPQCFATAQIPQDPFHGSRRGLGSPAQCPDFPTFLDQGLQERAADKASGASYRHHLFGHISVYISPDSADNWSVSFVRWRNPCRAAKRESLPEEVRGRVCGGTSSTRQFTPKAI